MDKSTKSLTIDQLIRRLQLLKLEHGNIEVILSSDPEGNGYGTLDADSLSVDIDGEAEPMLILYPAEQFTDF